MQRLGMPRFKKNVEVLKVLTPYASIDAEAGDAPFQKKNVKVLKVRNKLTSFEANPSMFVPPITSLKIDRNHLSFLSYHLVVVF
jgi:hypothetical protein